MVIGILGVGEESKDDGLALLQREPLARAGEGEADDGGFLVAGEVGIRLEASRVNISALD